MLYYYYTSLAEQPEFGTFILTTVLGIPDLPGVAVSDSFSCAILFHQELIQYI
jgi:hypothetical protein